MSLIYLLPKYSKHINCIMLDNSNYLFEYLEFGFKYPNSAIIISIIQRHLVNYKCL